MGEGNSSAGTIFSLTNQKAVIDKAVRISEEMDKNMEDAIDNKICDKVFEFVNNYSPQSFSTKLQLFKTLYEHKNFADLNSDYLKVRARAQFIFGKYLGGSMIEIFENNKIKANEMVTNMILYAGSRAKSSSPHWKASDISSF